ncbi:N-acetyl-alpha-D-glucosaminyl L-malate synthase [Camellia lanceoleosa]|uniref:N-acetyl-alpha-D-glucosaminyl L-malate synthase n=1 Tax=Camellia lanceoleosa TaxID=1840588 RepID=A0ACC0J6N4_9ERIC|nr:N-acetyl-alpha-D-glucosaminyl L-malate synthase [Camellia lanceoleosa]
MAKHSSSSGWLALQKQRWLFPLLVGLSVTTALAFILRASFDSPCDHRPRFPAVPDNKRFPFPLPTQTPPNPLTFMKSKRVLLVSHDLSLSGGPLLLMELAFLLRGVGAEVCWITNQKPSETDAIIYSLEHKMLHRGVQVLSAKGQEAMDTALKADLVVLNTAVAGKWLDAVLKENVTHVLPKVLWWIHEMRGVSRGKGQDLFLRAFYDSLLLIQERKLKVPSLHAVIVGSDMTAQTKFESELRNFVALKKIQNRVHFVNKTLTVAPCLAAIDVLVQNSQARGECFGRITIEAMGFQLPVLGTSAGGTTEIVVNERTGLLHPVGKAGVTPLAKNIAKLAIHVERRLTMGRRGHGRVKEMFLERHMAHRIAAVLKEVLQNQSSDKRCIENTLDEFQLENTMDGEGCEQWMSSRFSVPASKSARDQSSPAISLALNTVLQRDALMNMC